MASLLSRAAIAGAVVIGVLYQFLFKSLIFDTLGYGRTLRSLGDFPNVQCQKVVEPGLEACEDMWLHDVTGILYMACASTARSSFWVPAVDRLNASGRGSADGIWTLDTRASGPVSSRLKKLAVEGFPGNKGDASFSIHGIDIRANKHTDVLQIMLINHRPPFNPVTGEELDVSKIGANSTIEQFQTTFGSDRMRHVRTYAHDAIETPNRVAWVNDHAFVFTNDHSGKVGLRRHLDPLLGGGSVGYCDRSRCQIAKQFGRDFALPNGLVYTNNLAYVPSTLTGEIRVLKLNAQQPPTLEDVETIKVPFGMDNLSVDKDGNIFAAAFPKLHQLVRHFDDPTNNKASTTVFKVTPNSIGNGDSYEVVTVMEDNGDILPAATVAIHDAKTGRVFLGGVGSPYIAICETR
ncbi:hypothetical protein BJ878DRAFT_520957 [Calycina marina]|uniref:Calcium-dependent phosphotriesterase n=1 Tax=Calycina marina TaxID=1763456 RepID=A0A9P7YWN6_9HELO|nr:hypothetical protein BJ878DRAFT_520957 [Calycina marina]